MAEFLQRFRLQVTPKPEFLLLLQDVILPQKIPEGTSAADSLRNAVRIVFRQETAQTLDTGHHVGQFSLRFRGVDPGQCMMVFHTPAVNHIRLECADFFPERFFQFRQIDMGRGFRNGCIAAGFVNDTRFSTATVEDPDTEALLPQTAEDMIHPVNTALGFAADMGSHHAGSVVAQPQQFHFFTPLL